MLETMSLPPGVAINQANIGTTIRPSSTALLVIDSEDRYNDFVAKRNSQPGQYNYNPYNFVISKNQSIMNGFFTRLAVTEIVFPWAIPNINEKTGSIYVVYNGVKYLISFNNTYASGQPLLAVGFYTPNQLAVALQAAVRYVSGSTTFQMKYGYAYKTTNTLSYVENIPAFEYSTGNTDTVYFLPLDYQSSSYPYPTTTRQLYDLLGFNTADNSTPGVNVSYGNPTYAPAIKYVDIICPTLVYNQALKDTSSAAISQDSLCRVYLANADNSTNEVFTATDISGSGHEFCPPGCAPTSLYRQFNVPKYIQWVPNQPVAGSLVFQVLDDQGQILDPSTYTSLVNGQPLDWQMSLLVSEN